jgi:hypothetical protein
MASLRTNSSPVKEGRRVLGDKTTNASLTPAQDPFNASKHIIEKSVNSVDALNLTKKPFSPPQKAGRKRTIDELEERGTNNTSIQPLQTWTVPSPQDKFRIFEESASTFKHPCFQVRYLHACHFPLISLFVSLWGTCPTRI